MLKTTQNSTKQHESTQNHLINGKDCHTINTYRNSRPTTQGALNG
nr:MAG TPA: hypothetical protein [Caudoviricetes sp.]